jgi:PAS domain S-box-containing protein
MNNSDCMNNSVEGSKPYILFVEDEAVVRNHLAQALSDEFVVETAADGEEALKAVLRRRPDLVVTDLLMPVLSGIELVRTLRETPSTAGIPILMISGRAPDELRLQGFEVGADAYLAKPYSEKELRLRIRSMVHAAATRSELAKREERERTEHEAMLERAALLESITDAFYAVDRESRVTYMNQRALDYFGRSREQLVGRNIWEELPQGKNTVVEEIYRRVMRSGKSESAELLSPVTQRWVEVNVYPTPQGLAINYIKPEPMVGSESDWHWCARWCRCTTAK